MIPVLRWRGSEQKPVGNVVPAWGLCSPLWYLLIDILIVVAVTITVSESTTILIYVHNYSACETGKYCPPQWTM